MIAQAYVWERLQGTFSQEKKNTKKNNIRYRKYSRYGIKIDLKETKLNPDMGDIEKIECQLMLTPALCLECNIPEKLIHIMLDNTLGPVSI